MTVADVVATNLTHYNLWNKVEKTACDNVEFLCGVPPKKLADQDEADQLEWVVPKRMEDRSCTMAEVDSWFAAVERLAQRPKRVSLALVNDDGTVVYYFVHDGVVKPRQN